MTEWQIGDKIQNSHGIPYEILDIRGGPGRSGMGIVYVCLEPRARKPVAVKTIQERLLTLNSSMIALFQKEAEVWIRLGVHPNITEALYFDVIGGRPCIFLEFIEGDRLHGSDLRGWIQSSELNLDRVLDFSSQLCRGMIYAKYRFEQMGKNFVHRDIKPENLLINHGWRLKITDFGLANTWSALDVSYRNQKDAHTSGSVFSRHGDICGTPFYMSPEQCLGAKDIDARSDIYSFGCVLYEMLAGRPPFVGRNIQELLRHHIETPPLPLTKCNFPIPKELNELVIRCLDKNPKNRFDSFNELGNRLCQLNRNLFGLDSAINEIERMTENGSGLTIISLTNLGYEGEAIATLFGKTLGISHFSATF